MEVIFLLIGFSLIVALIFLALFFWAVKSGQYNDPHTPSIRMLFDNQTVSKRNKQSNSNRDE